MDYCLMEGSVSEGEDMWNGEQNGSDVDKEREEEEALNKLLQAMKAQPRQVLHKEYGKYLLVRNSGLSYVYLAGFTDGQYCVDQDRNRYY